MQNRLLNAQTDQYDRQVTDQNKLRELVPDAMSGNQPAASEVMGINPELGMKIQSHLGSMDASRREAAMKEAPLAAQLLEGVTDQSSYESAREKAMQMDRAYGTNLSKGFLPPNFDPQRTQQQLQVAKMMVGEKGFTGKLKPGESAFVAGEEVASVPALPDKETETSLVKNLRAAGIDPKSEQGRNAIMADIMGQQVSFEVGEDGRTKVTIGKGQGGGLTKANATKAQSKLIDINEGYERTKQIAEKFKPEFLTYSGKAGALWSAAKAKAGKDLTKQERTQLAEYADFYRTSISNLNNYIKEITGAALSEAEASRIRTALPDPGDAGIMGILSGQDPVTFKANLDSSMRDLEKARIRYEYYLKNGVSDVSSMADKTPLSDMQFAVNPDTGQRIVKVDGKWIPA